MLPFSIVQMMTSKTPTCEDSPIIKLCSAWERRTLQLVNIQIRELRLSDLNVSASVSIVFIRFGKTDFELLLSLFRIPMASKNDIQASDSFLKGNLETEIKLPFRFHVRLKSTFILGFPITLLENADTHFYHSPFYVNVYTSRKGWESPKTADISVLAEITNKMAFFENTIVCEPCLQFSYPGK